MLDDYESLGDSAINAVFADFDKDGMKKYKAKLKKDMESAQLELNKALNESPEVGEEEKEEKERLKKRYDDYGDCYSDLQSSLEVLRKIHNKGGHVVSFFQRTLQEYDASVDTVFVDTMSPLKSNVVIKTASVKKKLNKNFSHVKTDIYRKVDNISESYSFKNNFVLAVVVAIVFFAAGYNYKYGDDYPAGQKNVIELRFSG